MKRIEVRVRRVEITTYEFDVPDEFDTDNRGAVFDHMCGVMLSDHEVDHELVEDEEILEVAEIAEVRPE